MLVQTDASPPASQAMPRCHALVPAAGSGSRAGAGLPKQYRLVAGRSVIAHTLAALAAVGTRLTTLGVVLAPHDRQFASAVPAFTGRVLPVGGATRAASVLAGLRALVAHGAQPHDWVLVHDAARCLVTPADIDRLIDACLPDAVGGLLALPLPDTLKHARDGRVVATLPRGGKWLAQTPQMFRLGALHAAYEAHADAGFATITDEASAMEAAGHAPLLVHGSARNMKVTYPEDFAVAEALLRVD